MSLPDDPIIPIDPPTPESGAPLPSAARARRRRAARAAMFPADAEGQAALVASLSRRAYPSLELFVFSLVCGVIVGFGFLLDSQAILLLGILVTPLMTPWVGFLLSIYIGSLRFLWETLSALLVSALIVFLGGLLTGFAARAFPGITRNLVVNHAHLWLPELVVLAIAAIVLVASFARSENKPILPSILVAYAFYLPIIAAAFGLGSGLDNIWPLGLYVFIVHFAFASALGLITLFVLRLEPTKAGGIASGITLVALVIISGALMFPDLTSMIFAAGPTASPTSAPTLVFTASPSSTVTLAPTATPTLTNTPQPSSTPTFDLSATPDIVGTIRATASGIAMPPTASPTKISATVTSTQKPTASATLKPSATSTVSATPQPLPGKINAGESGGANLRQTPNGKYILTLINGTLVEVSPEKRIVNGVEWARVFATVEGDRLEGWVLSSVIEYENSITFTPTP